MPIFLSLILKTEYHGLVARSNVLAQLAEAAKGDYFIFLDADMEVAPGWLRQMVAPTKRGYHLVSGYTEVQAHDWFSRFQQMDWLNMITLLKVAADLGQPGTALGNNMLVSREAYQSAGGYEQIGPTYTEDNDLSLALKKKGYALYQLVTDQGSFTLAINEFGNLFKQRKRWLMGAFRQPLGKFLPVLFTRLFMLWAVVFAFWNYRYALVLMLSIGFAEMLLSLLMAQKTHTRFRFYIAFFAPIFNSVLDTFTLLSYPWNKQVIWKGRKL